MLSFGCMDNGISIPYAWSPLANRARYCGVVGPCGSAEVPDYAFVAACWNRRAVIVAYITAKVGYV